MSTTARKARKKAGQKFTRTPKVGTPMNERTATLTRGDLAASRAAQRALMQTMATVR